jgi:hypothetical protein
MAANGYAATSTQQVVAGQTAQTVAISGTTLRIINLGPGNVYVAMGESMPVSVSVTSGLAIRPGGPPEFLTVGSNTFLGFIGEGNLTARLNVSEGT